MATASMELTTFRESPQSAWGKKWRPGSKPGGVADTLLDAVPPAQKNPTEVVGCISYVNSYLSREGLHRRNTLPPVIFDLYSPPPPAPAPRRPQIRAGAGAGGKARELAEDEEDMAHRRGKVTRRKRLPSRTDQQDKVPTVSKQTKAALEEMDCADASADTMLVELAAYPGFNPHAPTPLPHGLETLQQMKRVTSAQSKLATKQEWFKESWCKLFYSTTSQAIFLDYFWWFFLHKYQTNQYPIQDLLFTRISDNYVKLLCDPINIKTKDSFLRMYPDMLAQCVYSTLLHAYPNSWNSFDEAFKSELCHYISLWQVGTKPVPRSWKMWELRYLEPAHLPKLEGVRDTPGWKSPKETFDFDALLEEAKGRAEEREKAKSCYEKKLSLREVKRNLLTSQHSSRRTSNDSSTSEKRIGVAMQQLQTLEDSSTSGAQLTVNSSRPGSSESQQHRCSLPSQGLPSDSTLKPEGIGTCKQLIEDRKRRRQSMPSKPKGLSMVRITNPEGEVVESETSSRRTSIDPSIQQQAPSSATTTTTTTTSARKPKKLHRYGNAMYPIPGKKGGRTASSAPLKHIGAGLKQDKTQLAGSSGVASGSRPTQHKPSSRTISAPVYTPSSHSKLSANSSRDTSTISAGARARPTVTTSSTRKKSTGEFKKMALSLRERAAAATGQGEPVTLQGPIFDHVMFNLHGHSPLVKHYMDRRDLTHVNEKEVVVGRTEISEEAPHDAICYKDILAESKAVGDSNREQFQRQYRMQRHAMISAEKKRVAASQAHEQDVKLMLGNRREVQHLSNELTLRSLQSKLDYNKQAISNVIRTGLKRVSTAGSSAIPHPPAP